MPSETTQRWADKYEKCLDKYHVILKFKKEIFLESFDPGLTVHYKRFLNHYHRLYVVLRAREIDSRDQNQNYLTM